MSKRLSPTIKCELCFKRFKSLSGHIKKHNYISKEYKQEFNTSIVSPLTRRRMKFARLKFILQQQNKFQTKKKIKIFHKSSGYKHTIESKEKIRRAHLGSKLSESHKMSISLGLLGHEVTDETRTKLSQVKFTDQRCKRISQSQSAEKGNAWKGGVSRHLYLGKNKYRLKKIFGNPLHCFFPGCNKVEGKNIRAVDCHHLDGNHENNPLDGTNWVPLCRRHHMLIDGRLKTASVQEIKEAKQTVFSTHSEYIKNNYIGEVKNYH